MFTFKTNISLKALIINGTAIASFSVFAPQAFAQVENATSIADPARISQDLLDIGVTTPDISEKIEVKETEVQNAPEGAEDIRFTLERLQVDGVNAYSQEEILAIYEDKIGSDISLLDIYKIANDLTNKYRNDGYILTQVVVPPQTIEGGLVKLQVVEGFIDQINIEGEERKSIVKQIRKYAENLQENNILNAKDLERYLLLINDLPGITARSILSPSETVTGASDLTIIVERDIYEAEISFNNYGSRYLGPYQLSFSDSANSWLGLNERMGGQLVVSGDKDNIDELIFFSGSYEQPVSRYGTKIGFTASITSTEPGYDLEQYDVEGLSKFASVTLSHPFVRSRTTNVYGRASFDLRNVDSKNNIEPTRRDRIRTIRVGATLQFMDSLLGIGINALDIELSKGVDVFGASTKGQANLTRANGNPKYSKAELQVQRMQRISPKVNLLIAGQGQLSATPLLSSEEFGVGGINIGRGYDSSEIVGDDGISGKIELQWNEPKKVKYLDNYQLFGFFDTGRVWNQDATTSANKRNSLSSVGFGVNADITERARANLGVSLPLTRDVDTRNDRSPRYYFNITQKF